MSARRLLRLFSFQGRLPRGAFWRGAFLLGLAFLVLLTFLEATFGRRSSLLLYPPFL